MNKTHLFSVIAVIVFSCIGAATGASLEHKKMQQCKSFFDDKEPIDKNQLLCVKLNRETKNCALWESPQYNNLSKNCPHLSYEQKLDMLFKQADETVTVKSIGIENKEFLVWRVYA